VTELKDFGASTVLVGSFNPLIFSPEWLQSANAIGPEESATAREHGIEVMAQNISSISFGSMKLVVEQSRFSLTVSDEPLVRAKDFPATCFRLLSHTPVIAMGFNLNATLKWDNIDKWHRFGDILAPKESWGDFLTDGDGKRRGGLRGLIMERAGVPGDWKGHIRCSVQVPEGVEREAVVQMNNHFDLGIIEKPSNGSEAYKVIEEVWDEAMTESRTMLERIRDMADAA
jgi:hypothetical protein